VNNKCAMATQGGDEPRGLALMTGFAVAKTPEGERGAHRARGGFQWQRVSQPAGQGRLPCTVSR